MKARAITLPLVAIVAVACLLGVQLASGGAKFEPTPVASPCAARPLPAPTSNLDQTTQTVVVLGLTNAACTLGISRERLLVGLPTELDRTALAQETGQSPQEIAQALVTGMTSAVRRLDSGKRLPAASVLIDSYVSELGLPGIAESAIKQLPASLVDGLLPTGPVLERAIAALDVNQLLTNLNDPTTLEPQLRKAILDAATAEAKARLLDQVPESLRGLLGVG